MSQRRISKVLKINRKTVARKLVFLAFHARRFNSKRFNKLEGLKNVQFDDLETIEHTKCKPLSVTLAVEKHTRVIIDFKVSPMPAKGHLAKKAFKKYGPRQDLRSQARGLLFQKLSSKLSVGSVIESDDNPHYKGDVKKLIPQAIHKTYLGQRGAVVGQGELKKVVFDPLFSLNHTFAMLRANINRLFRKTWCTTKLPHRLSDHIDLYVYYHNEVLLKKAS